MRAGIFLPGPLPGPIEVFQGDAASIGRAMGSRPRKPDFVPDWRSRFEFALACRSVVAAVAPEAVAKADAAARAGGFDRDEFVTWFFTHHAVTPVSPEACLGVCVSDTATVDGSPLAARNYHWTTADAPWRCLRSVRRSGARFASAGYTHHWAGMSDAMNSAGLFVAIHAVRPAPTTEPGITWHIAMDLVLETCATAREAADLLSSFPHIRPFCYMVADAGGDAVSVEAAPSRVAVRHAQGGLLVVSNHFSDASWRPGSPGQASPTSLARFEAALAFLRSRVGSVDDAAAAALLADHGSGICLGSHARSSPDQVPYRSAPGGEEWATLWGIIARPRERALAVSPGPPCRTPFYRLGATDLGFSPI